jgi:hypothetical protein
MIESRYRLTSSGTVLSYRETPPRKGVPVAIRRRFLWRPAGVSLRLALALAGAELAQAVDPVGSVQARTGVPAPNDPGNNVTALTSSAGDDLDIENESSGEFARRVWDLCCRVRDGESSTRTGTDERQRGLGTAPRDRRAEPSRTGAGPWHGVYGTGTSTTAAGRVSTGCIAR